MRFFYRMTESGGSWLAECEDLDSFGKASTPAAALEQLRGVLAERLDRPYAVAPPEDAEPLRIELVPLDDAYRLSALEERAPVSRP